MIVIDASALLRLRLEGSASATLRDRVARETGELHAPHLIDLEVAQVLRRFLAAGEIDELRAGTAFRDLADLRLAKVEVF